MKVLLGNRAKSVADSICIGSDNFYDSLSTFDHLVISTLVSCMAYNGGPPSSRGRIQGLKTQRRQDRLILWPIFVFCLAFSAECFLHPQCSVVIIVHSRACSLIIDTLTLNLSLRACNRDMT
jgi:hypothetical protein